jgi:LPXTG-site transpeptidase (sortase) family protein
MWSVRRAGIGVMALLLAICAPACGAERPSAPTSSAQKASRVATPLPIAAPITPPVPSAVPTGLSIPALGLTAVVQEMAASECPVLNPPTVDEAYWVGCRSKPGTDSDGTVFIIGHAVAGGQGVFARLQQLAIGNDVLVTTASGVLTYRVERTVNYAKFGEVQDSPEVMEKVPGRLVLVTCLLGPDGSSTDKNFLAQAQLVASSTDH